MKLPIEPFRPNARVSLSALALVGTAAAGIVLVRTLPILRGDGFPVGDGGFFASMALALKTTSPLSTGYMSYNGESIPLAYPPLGPILIGILPGQPPENEVLLTVIGSTVSVLAFWLMARTMLPTAVESFAAAICFGLLPSTWLVEGGDAVRGLALVLLLLAFALTRSVIKGRHLLLGTTTLGIVLGAALLSHPRAWTLGPISIVVIWACSPSGKSLRWLIFAAFLALVVTAPVTLMGIRDYGFAAYRDAFMSHVEAPLLIRAIVHGVTGLPALDIVFGLAVLGVCVALVNRQRFVPIWLVVMLLAPGSEVRYLAVPLALGAGIGWGEAQAALRRLGPRVPIAAAMGGVLMLIVAGLAVPFTRVEYRSVSRDDRRAISWMVANFQPNTRVAVIESDFSPAVGEWFPSLSGMTSVGSYQGFEWLPRERWVNALQVHGVLQSCRSVDCLPDDVDLLYISSDLQGPFLGVTDPLYERGTRIFRVGSESRP